MTITDSLTAELASHIVEVLSAVGCEVEQDRVESILINGVPEEQDGGD